MHLSSSPMSFCFFSMHLSSSSMPLHHVLCILSAFSMALPSTSMHWQSSSLPLHSHLLLYASLLLFKAFILLFYAFKIIFLASISSSSLYALILRSYVHPIHIFPPFFRVAIPRFKPGTSTLTSRRANNLAAPLLLPISKSPSMFLSIYHLLSPFVRSSVPISPSNLLWCAWLASSICLSL